MMRAAAGAAGDGEVDLTGAGSCLIGYREEGAAAPSLTPIPYIHTELYFLVSDFLARATPCQRAAQALREELVRPVCACRPSSLAHTYISIHPSLNLSPPTHSWYETDGARPPGAGLRLAGADSLGDAAGGGLTVPPPALRPAPAPAGRRPPRGGDRGGGKWAVAGAGTGTGTAVRGARARGDDQGIRVERRAGAVDPVGGPRGRALGAYFAV